MKTISRIVSVILPSCFVLLWLATSSEAAPEEPGSIPPEMRVLASRIGVWQKEVGVATTRWILGGKGQLTEHADRPAAPDAAFLVLYDADKKLYYGFRVDDAGGSVKSTGRWNQDKQTLTWTWDDGKGTQYVATEHLGDKNVIAWEYVAKDRQGQIVSKGGGTFRRKAPIPDGAGPSAPRPNPGPALQE